MSVFDLTAVLVSLAALFAYANHRFLKLPSTIGLTLFSLLFSLLLIAGQALGLGLRDQATAMLSQVDFNQTVLQGMLGFLLFAGALHIKLNDLRASSWPIALLATAGVVLSTILVGLLSWGVFGLLGLGVPFLHCLLFGALISPTDPIAVLAIVRKVRAPKDVETVFSGESLFNDGVGVVIFVALLEWQLGGGESSVGSVAQLLLREAGGGLAFGLALGSLAYFLLKSVDNYHIEGLLTVAVAMGGYAAAGHLHISGPIAIAVTGLLVGNQGRLYGMSATTRRHLDSFWELVDDGLKALLFVMVGLELLVLHAAPAHLAATLLLIPAVLLARFISVAVPLGLASPLLPTSLGAMAVLTWGGLRGGLSLAMALALPASPHRDLLLVATYGVVVFSILVQGMSVGPLIRKTLGSAPPQAAGS